MTLRWVSRAQCEHIANLTARSEALAKIRDSDGDDMSRKLIDELRASSQWCCIFEQEGHMRHGASDAPNRAATALERARTLCEMIVNASMGSSSRMRGESSIGWQKNDGADADSVRKCAHETLALITGKSNG